MYVMRAILACLFLALSSAAWAHSWYEPSCCSDKDCFQVEGKTLPDGRYLFIVNGVEYVKTMAETRQGMDEGFHACQPNPAYPPICFCRPFAGS
jgi:hypothetical protein